MKYWRLHIWFFPHYMKVHFQWTNAIRMKRFALSGYNWLRCFWYVFQQDVVNVHLHLIWRLRLWIEHGKCFWSAKINILKCSLKYFWFVIWNISDLPHEMQGWHKAPFGASYSLHWKWFDSFPNFAQDSNQIRIAVINVLFSLIFFCFIYSLMITALGKIDRIYTK